MRKVLAAATIAFLATALVAYAQTILFPNRGGTGTSTVPATGQVLVGQSSGIYAPQATSTLGFPTFADIVGFLSLSSWYGTTTDALDEGSSNLYYTPARVASYISSSSSIPHVAGLVVGDLLRWTGSAWGTTSTTSLGISWSYLTGIPSGFSDGADDTFSTTSANYWETQQTARTADDLSNNTTSDLAEGSQLYWTSARATSAVSALFAATNTSALAEGSHLYYTDARVGEYLSGSSTIPHIGGSALGDMLYWTGSAWATRATSTLGYSWNNLVSVPADFADGVDNTGGAPAWGTITGTLSNQTDLQTALNAKIDTSTTSLSKLVSFGSSSATTTALGHLAVTGTLKLGTDYVTDITGTGLTLSGGALTLDTSAIGTYIHSSSTIPKTYTANTFTGVQTIGNASTTNLSAIDSWLGTIRSAIWNGSSITDAYIDDTITASNYVLTSALNGLFDARLGATSTLTYLRTLPGLVSFGSSSATTTALGNLGVTEKVTVSSATATSTFPQLKGSYLSGFGLTTCDPTTGKLTYANGVFGCGTDQTGGGGAQTPWTSAINGAGYALTNAGAITGTTFTATSTTASQFPYASSTAFTISKIYNNVLQTEASGAPTIDSGDSRMYQWLDSTGYNFQHGIDDKGYFFKDGSGNNLFTFSPADSAFTFKSGYNMGVGFNNPWAPLTVNGQAIASYFTSTSTTATSTLRGLSGSYISGYGLSSCTGSSNKITWGDGTFRCETDQTGGGASGWTDGGTFVFPTSGETVNMLNMVASSTATSSIANLGGVLDATMFSGADIGAQINAAYAALPAKGGRIKVPRGSYSFSTAISFSTADKPVWLECEPDGATSLTYTGSATSTTYNVGAEGITSNTHYAGGISGCEFNGPDNAAQNAFLEIGGTQGASGFKLENTRVYNFSIGLYINNNTYISTFDHNFFNFNGRNVVFKSGGSNMGEDMRFTNNTFAAYGSTVDRCFDTGTYQTSITSQGNSYDDCQLYIGVGTLHFDSIGDHFENPSGNSNDRYTPIIIDASPDGLGSVAIRGATFVQQSTTKVPVAYIENRGSNLEVYSAMTWSDQAPVASFVEATTTNANTVLHSITAEAGSLTSIINSRFTTSLTDGFDYVSSKGGYIPFAWNASSTGSTYFYASGTVASILDNKLGWTQYGTSTAPVFVSTSTSGTSTMPRLSTSGILIGSDYVTDITGSGLSVTGGVLSSTGGTGTTEPIFWSATTTGATFASSTVYAPAFFGTTSTSTFAGLRVTGSGTGIRIDNLNTASCDLKATTDGTFYCGTDANSGGGGGGSSAWATTTSSVSGQLVIYPLNTATDIFLVGGNSSTTAFHSVDPVAKIARYLGDTGTSTMTFGSTTNAWTLGTSLSNYALRIASSTGLLDGATSLLTLTKAGNLGIATSSPWKALSVAGEGIFTDVLNLASSTLMSAIEAPSASPASKLYVFARSILGKMFLSVKGPSGLDYELQPAIFDQALSWLLPGSGTTVTSQGMSVTNVGTVSHPGVTTTNRASSTLRYRLSSAATANSASETRNASTMVIGTKGYFFRTNVVCASGVASRGFWGLTSGTGAIATNAEPSAFTQAVGFGWSSSSASTTLHFMVNDGSGNTSFVNLGSGFPTASTSVVYELTLFTTDGTSISYRAKNVNSGESTEGTVSTNLPTSTTALTPHLYMNNGGVAVAIVMDVANLYIQQDY